MYLFLSLGDEGICFGWFVKCGVKLDWWYYDVNNLVWYVLILVCCVYYLVILVY